MLNRRQYNRMKNRLKRYGNSMESLFPGKNSFSPEEIREVCKLAKIRRGLTNDELSSIEVFEFCDNPPEKYVAYVGEENKAYFMPNDGKPVFITTWTGERLGHAFMGKPYRSNFGDKRRTIRVYAINKKQYTGTYYYSAGNYCRLRLIK